MNKNSVYYELLEMSTSNIESPRYADFETFFERVESANKDMKKALNFIIKSYPSINENRLMGIYELFE